MNYKHLLVLLCVIFFNGFSQIHAADSVPPDFSRFIAVERVGDETGDPRYVQADNPRVEFRDCLLNELIQHEIDFLFSDGLVYLRTKQILDEDLIYNLTQKAKDRLKKLVGAKAVRDQNLNPIR